MDKFVTVSKPSSIRAGKADRDKTRATPRYNPLRVQGSKQVARPPEENTERPSSRALTKHLLSTLSDESNPITHSTIGLSAEYVTSTSTGHQVSEGRIRRKGYLEDRFEKLANQSEKPQESTVGVKVLENVRVYVDGYLSDTTDIEMKRIVRLAGGSILPTASGATHILTSHQLNGSKTHKIIHAKSRNKVHVVRPEWVIESIGAGKRRPEREYSVIHDATTKSLFQMTQ